MAKVKKRHHYLPRFYLKGFCDKNSRVWMYAKDNPGNPIDCTPGDAGVINKLYHLENSLNAKDEIENYFANEIETPASPAFKQLLTKKFPQGTDRERLALFFGMLMARTPVYINQINNELSKEFQVQLLAYAANADNFRKVYKKIHPNLNDQEIEEDRKFILEKEQYILSPTKEILISMALQRGAIFAIFLINMKWALIETNDEINFITSDNFMHIYHPSNPSGFYGFGLGAPGVSVHIPISHKLSLMLVNDNNFSDGLVFDINNPLLTKNGDKIDLKKLVKSLNEAIFIRCDKYVFANSGSEELRQCFTKILAEAKKIEDDLKQNLV